MVDIVTFSAHTVLLKHRPLFEGVVRFSPHVIQLSHFKAVPLQPHIVNLVHRSNDIEADTSEEGQAKALRKLLGYGWGVPNPSGSANEKIETPRESWPINRFGEAERLLRQEGVEEPTAEALGRALRRLGEDIQLDVRENLQRIEWHANVHTHASILEGGSLGASVWVYQTNSDKLNFVLSPDGSTLYSTDQGAINSRIHAVDVSDGSQVWLRDDFTNNHRYIAVNPDDGTVYITERGSETVYALSSVDGSTVWSTSLSSFSNQLGGLAVTSDGATLYTCGSSNNLFVLDPSNGSLLRTESVEFSIPGSLEIALDDSVLFMADANGNKVISIDPVDGSTLWTYSGHSDVVLSLDLDPAGEVLISGGKDNEVHAIDADNGANIWAFAQHTDNVLSAAVSPNNNNVYTAGLDGAAYSVLFDDASQVGEPYTELSSFSASIVASDNNHVFVGGSPGSNGEIHKVEVKDPA